MPANKHCAVIGYVPPPRVGCAESFYNNVMSFKTHYDLVLYSDYDWPDTIRMKASPEQVRGFRYSNGEANTWSVNNLVFATGVRIAAMKGYTHFFYLESDCRVRGDYWDKIVFDEFTAAGEGKLIGGSAVVYNACNRSMLFARRWRDFVAYHAHSPFPIPSYGFASVASESQPIVFVNGALGIYDVEFLRTIIDIEKSSTEAARVTAWDYHIGRELVKKFGDDAFNYVAHLSSIYSGYGNVLMTEKERIELLMSGAVVGVHQVKSNWIPEGNVAELDRRAGDEEKEPAVPTTDQSHAGSSPAVATPLENRCKTCLWWAPNQTNTIDKLCHIHNSMKEDDDTCEQHLSAEQVEQKVEYQVPQHTKRGVVDVPVSNDPVPGPVEILIVTYAKDFNWLEYCLLAIRKHLSGFQGVTIAHPHNDLKEVQLFNTLRDRFDVRLHGYYEVKGKGMLHHMVKMAQADLIVPNSTKFVMHLDADCIYHTATRPDDYFVYGLPVYFWRTYASLTTEDPKNPFNKVVSDCAQWKTPTEAQLGMPIEAYTMCRHPTVLPVHFYAGYRERIEKIQGKAFSDYMLEGRNQFPQDRMDFTAMGAYAFHSEHKKDFHWIDIESMPYPKDRQKTYHSHSGITPVIRQEMEDFIA